MKKMEGRMDMMEEKMAVHGELQRKVSFVHSELQRLGPLEKNVGAVLEKMEILYRVDRALQRMGDSSRPSWDRGKEGARETVTQQPISHVLESIGASDSCSGFVVVSTKKKKKGKNRVEESHLGGEVLKKTHETNTCDKAG